VARRHGMRSGALFAFASPPTSAALDGESGSVSVVVPLLQNPTQLTRRLQRPSVLVIHTLYARNLEDLSVQLGTAAWDRVTRNHVVVDPRIHQDATARTALVEAVDSEILHVYTADLNVEIGGQNGELDAAAPAVFPLDPAAVVIGFPF